ncbi:hypothetical protein HOU03_gp223 [Caulobacter phage CcrSC]|uniref:Uncharacterized protein n=1 Tax=Caulobacter phage CcrSC TaxID=2283272 RepID=A0A385EFZ8_9CAUD|nr:hypothetical protein HOU03_gp223 [Caulobacter phage CcrSC]AXQ70045.1 hypothetical protein CcrSC_gp463 [Caulobacter phage CcrSC]
MTIFIDQVIPAAARTPLFVVCLTPLNETAPLVYETRPTRKEAEDFAYASLSRGYRRADVFEQVPVASYRIER